MKSHSSLNAEFDEANEQILAELAAVGGYELVCQDCGSVYDLNAHNRPGMYCVEKVWNKGKKGQCGGKIDFAADEVEEDEVPDSLECWKCGNQSLPFETKEVGKACYDPQCLGTLIKKVGKMINLPSNVKTGKKSWGTGQSSGQGSIGGWNGATYVSDYKACSHPGNKVVFEWNDKKIYGTNTHSIDEKSGKWDLIIDLAGIVTMPSPPTAFVGDKSPKKYLALRNHLNTEVAKLPSEVLRLHWADMGAPPVTLDFWLKLWELLPEKTVIGCYGGHGRTGTCIASLMIATGIDYYSAVKTVRAEHCHKAIESLAQENYLHDIYLEVLKKELGVATAAKDALIIKDIEEEVAYALDNTPSKSYKSKWEKEDKKKGTKQDSMDSGTDVAVDLKLQGYTTKVEKGQTFVRECTATGCKTWQCKDVSHMAWVPYEYSDVAIYGV